MARSRRPAAHPGSSRPSRRSLLRGGIAGGIAVGLSAAGWARAQGANERVRLASIGCGGKGWSDLLDTAASEHASVAALCDIDESQPFLGQAAEKFPDAERFTDWRRLLDKPQLFDACIVSTPDHMHASPSLAAMHLGKHVQCQKPLTHTVFEARQMREAAERFKVVTQMGNQIQSHPAYRTAVKLVHDGTIGKVREVHSWQPGAMGWRKVDARPAGAAEVPATVRWDEWLGVAPARPFQPEIYHPFNWRAWRDFSNGQLGDFGCHILDPVFMALGISAPRTVRAEAENLSAELWATKSRVVWEFPGTPRTAGPTVTVTWYDGEGHVPTHERLGLAGDVVLPGSGSAIIGTEGTLLVPHVEMPRLAPTEKFASFEIPVQDARNHYTSWIDGIRGTDATTSHFGYSGPLTETVLLGTIAIRHPGRLLSWNAPAMTLTGAPHAGESLTKAYRGGWMPAWV